MSKARIILVTDAQVEAARMIVDHDKAVGRETSEAVRKIAGAETAAQCTATWPPDAVGDQMRLLCTLAAGHDGPHEAWATSNTEPYKTWRDDDDLQEQR